MWAGPSGTLALARTMSSAMGMPTMAERPRITQSLPSSSTLDRLSSPMQPAGVQGTLRGWPCRAKAPRFWAVSPSASLPTSMASMTLRSSRCSGSGS